jgi:hypothetical protein
MSNKPHLTFDEIDWRIYLNQNNTQQDITEDVIKVMSQWFIHTEISIGLHNERTGTHLIMTCVEIDDQDIPHEPTKH